MAAIKYLEELFHEFKMVQGSAAARETVSSILFNIIHDIEEAGEVVSEETMEKKLSEKLTIVKHGSN